MKFQESDRKVKSGGRYNRKPIFEEGACTNNGSKIKLSTNRGLDDISRKQ